MRPLTKDREIAVLRLLADIKYKDGWRFELCTDRDTLCHYIQIHNHAGVCSVTGEHAPWRGKKHYLSSHVTNQEVVGAVFALVAAAEEHEMRELFRYRGRSIYNPHLNPDKLVEVASRAESFCTRDDSMTEV